MQEVFLSNTSELPPRTIIRAYELITSPSLSGRWKAATTYTRRVNRRDCLQRQTLSNSEKQSNEAQWFGLLLLRRRGAAEVSGLKNVAVRAVLAELGMVEEHGQIERLQVQRHHLAADIPCSERLQLQQKQYVFRLVQYHSTCYETVLRWMNQRETWTDIHG